MHGCILLVASALNRIRALDVAGRLAVVEPGVLNGDLDREARRYGLCYAPDPSSRDISTIGGNIATNAGGACCLKYGVTGDHVAALQVALADGTLVRTGARTRKNVAGLDLTRLLVGSEGTLGVIVEATVRLNPVTRPPATLLAFFPDLSAACEAVLALAARGDLSLLELMDQVTLEAVEALTGPGLDDRAAAALLVQHDGPDAPTAIGEVAAICRGRGAADLFETADPDEGAQLLGARRLALPAPERKGTTPLDDVAVPLAALPEMIRRVQRAAARQGGADRHLRARRGRQPAPHPGL